MNGQPINVASGSCKSICPVGPNVDPERLVVLNYEATYIFFSYSISNDIYACSACNCPCASACVCAI